MIQLRQFQADLYGKVCNEWLCGHQNVMAVAPTGAGKTVIISHAMNDESGYSVAIAHRQELVSQISLALARNGVEHRIIGSAGGKAAKLLPAIAAMHTYEFGRPFLNQNARAAVAGVNTLAKHSGTDPWFKRVRLQIHDECFPAGTMVDGLPIERLQVGDIVTAFDERSGEFHKRPVLHVFKNKAPEYMVRVHVGHHVLECTAGHPLWTRRGWVLAANICESDEVLINDSYMLHVQFPGGSERAQNETVRNDRAGVLQQGLFHCVPGEGEQRNNGTHESDVCKRAHDAAQPDETCGRSRQGFRLTSGWGPRTESARREREAGNRTGANFNLVAWALRLCSAAFNKNRAPEQKPARAAGLLQTGLGAPAAENCSRSGRTLTPGTFAPGAGRKEGCVFNWARVARAEIFKRADLERPDDGFVYNIEVGEFHTYVADGIIVHNCHHVLKDNLWGRAAALFPNARALLPTATPCRADGKGLGRHAHGIVDAMVEAPSMRDIINMGYLTDYRVAVPPNSRFHREALHVSATTGDFVREEMVAEVKKAQIVGDVVASYIKFASGKRGVTFCVDVEEAERQAAAFCAAGVPAVALSGNTPDAERHRQLMRLRRGEILQVTNVDLFGEGFDLPAIEVVSFARPTKSFGLYCQQFGRVLRLMLTPDELRGYNSLSDLQRRVVIAASGKPYGLIIDHVGNVVEHKLPDVPRVWTLDARERSGASSGRTVDEVPMRVCKSVMCLAPYERVHSVCPYCGEPAPEPAGRSRPEQVDGDLTLLDEVTLKAMRGEIAKIDGPAYPPHGVPEYVARAIVKRHHERQGAQKDLRGAIAWWAGWQSAIGASESESYRRFYFKYGVDVASAQTLGAGEAEELAQRVHADLRAAGIDTTQPGII
jgi:superfamily II DNA or RNA helicase